MKTILKEGTKNEVQNMNPEFSLNYGEKRYVFSVENNAVYNLEDEITVRVEANIYKDYDAVEWVLSFENNSDKNSQIISDICDCDSLLSLKLPPARKGLYQPDKNEVCVITMKGMVDWACYGRNDPESATEYSFHKEYLDKPVSVCNIGGRSSNGMIPFFDVTCGGEGYIAAIGWSGDWKAYFSKSEQGVKMKTGLKTTQFYLKPGEKIRTTSILIMKYDLAEEKHNKFRRLIKNKFSHKNASKTEIDGLMAFELWGSLNSEEMKKRITELKNHDIKFDYLWIDAGWYGVSTTPGTPVGNEWSEQTGNWTINSSIHPNGLKDVSECALDAGMKMMFWVEPERARPGTEYVKKHSEWFLSCSDELDKILNYGNEDAMQYAEEMLSQYIKDLDVACYRQDFNANLTKYFAENDEKDRYGITEIKHISGMYRLWDNLLKKFPGLIIDNCSSGGKRIDIETLKRSIPFFRSDYQCFFNANPEVLQIHNTNSSAYFPYIGCTSKIKSDTYAIRSSYSSSWGGAFYNAIFQSMDEDDFAWAKKITDEYKSIRKYMSMDFYNHGSACFDETAWTIWQYHDKDTGNGIVMAFRRCNSPFDFVNVELKGLLESKSYTFTNLDDNTSFEGGNRLQINLPTKRSCTILEYKAK